MFVYIHDIDQYTSFEEYVEDCEAEGNPAPSKLEWLDALIFEERFHADDLIGESLSKDDVRLIVETWAVREFSRGIDECFDVEVFSSEGDSLGVFTVDEDGGVSDVDTTSSD